MTLDWSLVDPHPLLAVSWGRLRRLSLSYSIISEEGIRNILVGSPQLESLVLDNCQGFSAIRTGCSASLRTLGVHDYGNCSLGTLRISIPRVESLTLKGFFNYVFVKLEDVSSLKDATVDIITPDEDAQQIYRRAQLAVVELLCNLLYIDQLTIGYWCIKALSTFRMNVPFPLSNWKSLTLNTHLSAFEATGITTLLEIAPNMKSLLVDTTQKINDYELNLDTSFPNINYSGRLPQKFFQFL